uniref:FecR protein domain-containing protein n=1 Tax=Magnetococcus massalia (strain MO-1) TaxID=451514 RepID=A0A1S7LFF7_MAGMO|nr:Conserved protein of unknown function. putative RTX toxins and related Ca2+-binding protein [Candidatus Magnetococcus massalia]
MLHRLDTHPFISSQPTHIVSVTDGERLVVPGDELLLTARYVRQGSDLLLEGTGAYSGESVLIQSFFYNETEADLWTQAGARVEHQLATRLAGSEAVGLYAQADTGSTTVGGDAGVIDQLEGQVFVVRDGIKLPAAPNMTLKEGDIIETGADGRVGLTYADDTTFSLGTDGRLVIESMEYDPTADSGSNITNVLQGTFSFVSGDVAKLGGNAMMIKTPVAEIAVRGTTVAADMKAIGQDNSFTLLQDADGGTGAVDIINAAGKQTLNQANQTTTVSSFNLPPSKPFIMPAVEVNKRYGSAIEMRPTQKPKKDKDDKDDGEKNGKKEGKKEAGEEVGEEQNAEEDGGEQQSTAEEQTAELPPEEIVAPLEPAPLMINTVSEVAPPPPPPEQQLPPVNVITLAPQNQPNNTTNQAPEPEQTPDVVVDKSITNTGDESSDSDDTPSSDDPVTGDESSGGGFVDTATTNSGTTLATKLLGGLSGLSITGSTYVGSTTSSNYYDSVSFGTKGDLSFALTQGILLTSGTADLANSSTSTSLNGQASSGNDSDFYNATQITTTETSSLSITFTAPTSAKGILFKWMFGTEEYPDQGVTDVAGVLYNGANDLDFNDDTTVQFKNNVNEHYFFNNNSNGALTIEYDGITSPQYYDLEFADGATSHTIKILAGNTSDSSYDSGLFISAIGYIMDPSAASEGNDIMQGTHSGETISGGAGDDIIDGEGGTDNLNGGSGSDLIYGSSDADYMTGGAGADMFFYGSPNTTTGTSTDGTAITYSEIGTSVFEADTITDFNSSEGDQIALGVTGGWGFDINSSIVAGTNYFEHVYTGDLSQGLSALDTAISDGTVEAQFDVTDSTPYLALVSYSQEITAGTTLQGAVLLYDDNDAVNGMKVIAQLDNRDGDDFASTDVVVG